MQGRLRGTPLRARIETRCAECERPIRFDVDSDLSCGPLEEGVQPLVFEPEVDWSSFRAPNILDGY